MTAIVIFTVIVALSVGSILSLLYRLNGFQHEAPYARKNLFLRRWSYILKAESYVEPGPQLLPKLRLSLTVLAVSVVAAVVSLLLFLQRQAR